MVGKDRVVALALLAIVVSAFFIGRTSEERALRAKNRMVASVSASRTPESTPSPPSYRELDAAEIVAMPFGEFYEALRSAPNEARQKWAAELEKMPAGPRRVSASIAFYKLLVQFDPSVAAKMISAITDEPLQNLAVGCAIDAAPGFAMREMAELVLSLNLSSKSRNRPNNFADVMFQWMAIDPAAVGKFLDDHPEKRETAEYLYSDVVSQWAALDPAAARAWMEKKEPNLNFDKESAFVSGLYENDRAAALSYALAHATEPDMIGAVSSVLSALYLDSKEDAKKFIETLPDERTRHDAVHRAFEWMIDSAAEETGEPQRTPRAVADWLTLLPPTYWEGTLRRAFERWADGPPEEVFAWIQQQPPAIKDAVAAEYSIKTFEKPKPEAILPVIQIADPKLREQLLLAMLRNTDRSFDEWKDSIAKTPASPAQKEHVLEVLAAVEAEKAKENDQGSEK